MEYVNQKWKSQTISTDGSTPTRLNSIPPMLWSMVYQRLQPITELNMGSGECQVIRWSHKHYREIAVSRYLSCSDQIQHTYAALADYFSGKCAHEEKSKMHLFRSFFCNSMHHGYFSASSPDECSSAAFSQPLLLCTEKELYNVRKLMELPLCLERCGRRQELEGLLTDYSWIKGKILTSSCADLVKEFSAVLPVVPLQR